MTIRFKSCRLAIHILLYAVCIACLTPCCTGLAADELPEVSQRAPVPVPHFPDKVHAVVWRNWGLVPPARVADVLGTTADKVKDIASSMGLPRDIEVPSEMEHRGYITIIRRNWHLLPYEQLEQLLGVTPEELAFTLREDDVLYIKLGSLKPKCEPVKYVEPSPEVRRSAAEIKRIVEQQFGELQKQHQEPRFSFVSASANHQRPQYPSRRRIPLALRPKARDSFTPTLLCTAIH